MRDPCTKKKKERWNQYVSYSLLNFACTYCLSGFVYSSRFFELSVFLIVLILEHSPANFSLALLSPIIFILSVVQFSRLTSGVFETFVSHPAEKITRDDTKNVAEMFFKMLTMQFQED